MVLEDCYHYPASGLPVIHLGWRARGGPGLATGHTSAKEGVDLCQLLGSQDTVPGFARTAVHADSPKVVAQAELHLVAVFGQGEPSIVPLLADGADAVLATDWHDEAGHGAEVHDLPFCRGLGGA